MTSTTLARRATVTELVRTYEQAVADIRQAFATIAAAEQRLNDAFTLENYGSIYVRDRYGHTVDFRDPSATLDHIKREAWWALFERLEIRKALSVARWEQVDQQLRTGELPDITVESVWQFAEQFTSQLDNMWREKAVEVFEFLRPRNSRYKRNSELEIPPRVVLQNWIDCAWSGHFRVNHYRVQECTALESVFLALDGRGTMPRDYQSALHTTIEKCTPSQPTAATEYFEIRCCRNRNLHVRFLRLDLLDQFNKLVGGKRLRPGKAA